MSLLENDVVAPALTPERYNNAAATIVLDKVVAPALTPERYNTRTQ